MAYDKVVDSAVLDAGLKQIADAIREKGGTSGNLAFPTAMADAIAAIEAGGGSGVGGANWGTITPVSYTNIIDFGVAIPEKNFFIAIMPYEPSTKSFGASYIYHFYYINIEGTENAFSQNTSPTGSKSLKPSFDRNNNTATFGTYIQGGVEYIWFMGGIV